LPVPLEGSEEMKPKPLSADFLRAALYVLKKNAALYRRLARAKQKPR
jgi:hypothetical protein